MSTSLAQQVAELYAQGYAPKAIAQQLHIPRVAVVGLLRATSTLPTALNQALQAARGALQATRAKRRSPRRPPPGLRTRNPSDIRPVSVHPRQFWERTRPLGLCLQWQGWRASTGTARYGNVAWNGEYYSAHVIAWMLMEGELPPRLQKTCSTPLCVLHWRPWQYAKTAPAKRSRRFRKARGATPYVPEEVP